VRFAGQGFWYTGLYPGADRIISKSPPSPAGGRAEHFQGVLYGENRHILKSRGSSKEKRFQQLLKSNEEGPPSWNTAPGNIFLWKNHLNKKWLCE
jgi:hypothetical protein